MSTSPSTYIPYGAQDIDAEDIQAAADALAASVIARGPTTIAFEAAVACIVRASHVVACSSGTAGLHLACLAAGIGPGDEV
ncbi:DegT/DnrJ/EryC1/StrS family aminotransferase, partial [Candidatus Uhrbacteria bacterium]|nr:DegT/DnrJ/EryC1/StrS family aminotransferase [Candidatus Uhrbacteria bacterium]